VDAVRVEGLVQVALQLAPSANASSVFVELWNASAAGKSA
jgi:hypothetical protein